MSKWLTPNGIRVDQLASLMRASEWQRTQLDCIKTNRTYRICRAFIKTVDQLCCANLYDQTDRQVSRRLRRRTSTNVANSMRSNALRGPNYKSNSSRPSENHRMELMEANERVFGSKRPLTNRVMLARLVLVCFLTSLVVLTISTYYQYKFDIYKYHLNRYRLAEKAAAATTDVAVDTLVNNGRMVLDYYHKRHINESKLEAWLEAIRHKATTAGSFLLEQSIFAECAYILMMGLCTIIYLWPILYYRYGGVHNCYFIRLQLDWDQEQMNCNMMIQDIVEQVVDSSELFTKISLDELQRQLLSRTNFIFQRSRRQMRHLSLVETYPLTRTGGGMRPLALIQDQSKGLNDADDRDDGLAMARERVYQMEHLWTDSKLKQLALSGQLQPLDRNRADQVAWTMLFQVLFMSTACQSCFVWNICLFSSMPYVFGFSYQWGFMDILSMFNLYGLNIMLTVCGCHYFSQGLVHCRNSVAYVRGLQKLITEFILLNQLKLKSLLVCDVNDGADKDGLTYNNNDINKQHQWSPVSPVPFQLVNPNDYELLNTKLLLILAHYKLFMAQMRRTKETFRCLLISAMIIMTMFPLIARVHMPYLKGTNAKGLAIIVCLILVGLPDLVVMPLCWLNIRCLALYHNLYSLIACLANSKEQLKQQQQATPSAVTPIGFYHEHTIWLLRRELNHPEAFKHQFSVSALGIELSYGEMLKLHFWLGLIIVTFCVDFQPSSFGGLLGSASRVGAAVTNSTRGPSDSILTGLFSDPLGIESYFD